MIERLIDSPIPMPLGLVVKKALNSFSAVSRVNPDAGVQHRHVHLAGFVLLRSNEDLTGPVRDWRHSFNTVHQKVDNHLLQLDPIAENRGQCGREFRPQRHPMAEHFTLHQKDSLADDIVDVQRYHLRLAPFGECTNPLDHFARPIGVPDDALHGGSHLVRARRLEGEQSQANLAVGDDRGERLVNFVGDRGRQLSQSHHAADVREIRLRLTKRFFGALALEQGGDRRESQNDKRNAGNRQRQLGLIETCVYLGLVNRARER